MGGGCAHTLAELSRHHPHMWLHHLHLQQYSFAGEMFTCKARGASHVHLVNAMFRLLPPGSIILTKKTGLDIYFPQHLVILFIAILFKYIHYFIKIITRMQYQSPYNYSSPDIPPSHPSNSLLLLLIPVWLCSYF